MGCSSNVDTKEGKTPNKLNQELEEQNIDQNIIEQNKIQNEQVSKNNEQIKSSNVKEEKINENETNEEILYLEYETTSDNEEILLFGNEVDEFDDYSLPFYEREHTNFDIFYNSNKIDTFYYTFDKAGVHLIKMIIK